MKIECFVFTPDRVTKDGVDVTDQFVKRGRRNSPRWRLRNPRAAQFHRPSEKL